MDNLDKRIESLSPAKRALLELRLKQSAADQSRVPAIVARGSGNPAPLSFAQQRLWFLNQLEPDTALYNVPRALQLNGRLDLNALQKALTEIVRRHEVMRTHFELVEGGDVFQIVDEVTQLPLPLIDLSDLPIDEKEARAKLLTHEEANRPFDLATGPLLRAQLLRLESSRHVLLLTNHHIISDAWSGSIFFTELSELYNAFARDGRSTLAPLAIQYADFAAWQREWLQGNELQRQLQYWKQQLSGVTSILELPTDFARSSVKKGRGAGTYLTFSKELTVALNELSRREGATLFMTLLTAFQILLWRYSGQSDIVVGSPIAGRNRAEIEKLIGFFINTLALRTDLSGNPSFRQLLSRVRETALGAYAHQDLPFEKLVEELQPERDLARNPLFQVMFQLQNAAGPIVEMKDLTVSSLAASTETAKFDLMLVAAEGDGALSCVMEYNAELFRRSTVELMLQQYGNLLADIAAQPDKEILRLSLLTESERKQIVVEWNDTDRQFPAEQTIHGLFAAQALRHPNDVALIAGEEGLTFSELNARANQIARFLRRRGVRPEVRVAICLERSIDMIAGLLGILKAGGAYVPLEPHYPAERISFIIENSEAAFVLTQSSLANEFQFSPDKVVCLDEIRAELAGENVADFSSGVTAANAAHVIYTSGSTGQPKGVISAHSASVNRFAWMWDQYPSVPGEVFCQKTALSFVDSIWEIFGPLLQGVPLAIIPDEVVKDPPAFLDALHANKVTRLVLVPSLLRVMLESEKRVSDDLRICVCSGEALPVELAAEFGQKWPDTKLINLYGSSEVAADVTCFEVQTTSDVSNVPIGRPIANTSVYVLDSELQPSAVGVPGELYVAGEGLARGYLNRPDLTAERFVPDPFSVGGRLFRTGDVARYLVDGNIEYRGRRDHQVKLRGFRIELGEIETALISHSHVNQAVVMLRSLNDQNQHDKQLVAYVVADGEAPAPADLRTHVRRTLPDFMVPAVFVTLPAMPLTASGKINRLALPAPGPVEAAEGFVAPRTQTEELLANIWAAELKVNAVGANDDFFALGGHSLLLTRIAARIREVFQIEIPIRVLFEAPTVSALAERVETMRRSGVGLKAAPPVPRAGNSAPVLSFAQERLWFFDQIEPGSAAYNIPRALRLTGSLDRDALKQSFASMQERHEVLRSTFHNINGKPELAFRETITAEIPVLDLGGYVLGEREEKLAEFVNQEAARPFDLANGPPIRLALAKLAEEDHVLVLTMHHIVSDGWSVAIALRDLIAGYNAVVNESAALLPGLPVQYADFAAWQREHLAGIELRNQIDFWREQLGGAPAVINLPLDRARPGSRSFSGARHELKLSTAVSQGLKELARSERGTLFMTLLTAWQLLLACLTGDNDIITGSPAAGRERPETENLIGYFVNTLVLRNTFADDMSFRDSLNKVREATLRAFAHQDVPFEKLVDELGTARSLSVNPLFQVWFVLQNATVEREHWQGITTVPVEIDSATTRHDLQLSLWETDAGLEGALTFSTDLFDRETVVSIGERFVGLLSLIVEQPELKLRDLRKHMSDIARAHHEARADRLMNASHTRLRSTKRRAVDSATAFATGSAEKI